MARNLPDVGLILDATSDLIVSEGFDRVTVRGVAHRSQVSPQAIIQLFGSFDDVFVSMLNREFAAMTASIADEIGRDPRGGLLSRMYLYILSAVYERPLARVLYTVDPKALNTIMRTANSFDYAPSIGSRTELIEALQQAGMVRREVDAPALAHALTTFSAGLALTAPHGNLDMVVRGICSLIANSADTDAVDTRPGKAVFFEWSTRNLATGRQRRFG